MSRYGGHDKWKMCGRDRGMEKGTLVFIVQASDLLGAKLVLRLAVKSLLLTVARYLRCPFYTISLTSTVQPPRIAPFLSTSQSETSANAAMNF